MRKIKVLFTALTLLALTSNAFGADATVTFVSGKVEVERGGKWVPLQKGDTVAKSETISTGFQSEVKIKVLDSVMYLGPVTRITLEELSSSGSQDNVNVYLKTGTARSQVKHVDNKRVNYQVHTAVAVASCRGTDWIIDDSNNVEGIEGTVAVSAYKPPVENPETEGDKKTEEAEGEGDKKTEDSGDKKAGDSGDAETGKDSGKADSEKSDNAKTDNAQADTTKADDKKTNARRGADKPTSDEGVLVKANQSVSVSGNNSVSAPVKNVVKKAVEIKSAVSSAAAKNSAGGEKSGVETPKTETPSAKEIMEKVTKTDDKKNTGDLLVKLKLPGDK